MAVVYLVWRIFLPYIDKWCVDNIPIRFKWFKLGSAHKCYLCKSCSTALLPETVETHRVTFWWLTVFLFDGYKTCPRIWLCSVAPWLNCCTIQKLESSQKRALRVIHQIVYDMPYDSACEYVGVQSLSARRSELGRRFFRSVTVSDSCLHDLLPQGRDSEILSRLRRHTVYPIPWTKTNKYRSLIHYALAKYQWSNKII